MEKKGEKQKAEGTAAVDATDRFEIYDAHSEFSFRDKTYQKQRFSVQKTVHPWR